MTESSAGPSLPIEEAYGDFLARYPSYQETTGLDILRAVEYSRIDQQGQVYLDYTGGSLYGESQLHNHMELLRSAVFGNPHSANPASVAMTEHVERARRYVLTYFHGASGRLHRGRSRPMPPEP